MGAKGTTSRGISYRVPQRMVLASAHFIVMMSDIKCEVKLSMIWSVAGDTRVSRMIG